MQVHSPASAHYHHAMGPKLHDLHAQGLETAVWSDSHTMPANHHVTAG